MWLEDRIFLMGGLNVRPLLDQLSHRYLTNMDYIAAASQCRNLATTFLYIADRINRDLTATSSLCVVLTGGSVGNKL
jgi:hypothetical protein